MKSIALEPINIPVVLTTFIVLLFFLAPNLRAQDSTDVHTIDSYWEDRLEERIDSIINEERSLDEDPADYRLFLASTGRAKNKFRFAFTDYDIFIAGFTLSLPYNITINGGMFLPGENKILWLAPKLSIINFENYSLAIGGTKFFVKEEKRLFKINKMQTLYGVQTFTIENVSITTGVFLFEYEFVGLEINTLADFLRLDSENVHRTETQFVLGFEVDSGNGFKYMNEFWTSGNGNFMKMIGPRFYGNHVTLDIAAIIFDGGIVPIPYVSLSVSR